MNVMIICDECGKNCFRKAGLKSCMKSLIKHQHTDYKLPGDSECKKKVA